MAIDLEAIRENLSRRFVSSWLQPGAFYAVDGLREDVAALLAEVERLEVENRKYKTEFWAKVAQLTQERETDGRLLQEARNTLQRLRDLAGNAYTKTNVAASKEPFHEAPWVWESVEEIRETIRQLDERFSDATAHHAARMDGMEKHVAHLDEGLHRIAARTEPCQSIQLRREPCPGFPRCPRAGLDVHEHYTVL